MHSLGSAPDQRGGVESCAKASRSTSRDQTMRSANAWRTRMAVQRVRIEPSRNLISAEPDSHCRSGEPSRSSDTKAETSARHPQGQWVEGPREPSVHRTTETGSRGPGKTPKTSCANTRFGCIGTRCRAFSFGWIIFFDRAESEHSCGLDSDRNASGFQRENLRRCAVGVLRASPGAIQGPEIRETAVRPCQGGAGGGRQGRSRALGHRPGHADSSNTTLLCAGSSLMPSVPADLNWRKSMGE